MSILIEGMEMPPAGRYAVCITHDSKGGIHWVFQNQDTLEFLKHGAVAEVTEPHGRLIDADALLMWINHEVMEAYMDGACYGVHPSQERLYLLGEIIDDAPTIIPASESKERPVFLPQYELTPRSEEGKT